MLSYPSILIPKISIKLNFVISSIDRINLLKGNLIIILENWFYWKSSDN